MSDSQPETIRDASGRGLFAISPHLILPETQGRFSVYLRQDGKLVLYAARGETFTIAHRERLSAMGVRQIWIESEDRADFDAYLRKNIGRILSDETIPEAERAEAWFEVSTDLAQEIFVSHLPRSVSIKRFAKIESLLRESAGFFRTPEALRELSRLLSKGFKLFHHGLGVMILTASVLDASPEVGPEVAAAASLGALLHDIGLTRLPQALTEKNPQQRTPEEEALFRGHPTLGVAACSALPLAPETLHAILFHHEREDGSGYPTGLAGRDIPLHVKVVALCNVYDGLIRPAPWRPAFSPYEALSAIKSDRRGFDLELLRRLILVLANAKIT
jgi:response regulator RpfG family c-di-GMP phosphodiesterase